MLYFLQTFRQIVLKSLEKGATIYGIESLSTATNCSAFICVGSGVLNGLLWMVFCHIQLLKVLFLQNIDIFESSIVLLANIIIAHA